MSFREVLEKGRFAVTTEVSASVGEPLAEVTERLSNVIGHVDGVSLKTKESVGNDLPSLHSSTPGSLAFMGSNTEGSRPPLEAVVGDTLIACKSLQDNRLDPIYRAPARLMHRPELEKNLLVAGRGGVENLLVFTEDYRVSGDSLQELMFFHVDTAKLFSVIDGLREGRDRSGKDLVQPIDFSVGAGVEVASTGDVPDMQIRQIGELVERGVSYIQTTPIFDVERFETFVNRVKPLGLPVVAELMMIRNAPMARHINRYFRFGIIPDEVIEKLSTASDKERASFELFKDLMRSLREICDGVHIVPFGAEEKLHLYLNEALWG